MTEWKDETSYRRGDRASGKEPTAWSIHFGRLRAVVVKGHIRNPGVWSLTCDPFFDVWTIGPETAPASEMQAVALQMILEKLEAEVAEVKAAISVAPDKGEMTDD